MTPPSYDALTRRVARLEHQVSDVSQMWREAQRYLAEVRTLVAVLRRVAAREGIDEHDAIEWLMRES